MGDKTIGYDDVKWFEVDSHYKRASNALKIAATSNEEFDVAYNFWDNDRLGILFNPDKGRFYLIAHDRNAQQCYGTVAYMLDSDGCVMQKITPLRHYHKSYDGKQNKLVDTDEEEGDDAGGEQFIFGDDNGGLSVDQILDNMTLKNKQGGQIYLAGSINSSGLVNEDIIIEELTSMLADKSKKVKQGVTSFIVYHIENMKFDFASKGSISKFYRYLQNYKSVAEEHGIKEIVAAVAKRKRSLASDCFSTVSTTDETHKDFKKVAEINKVLKWLKTEDKRNVDTKSEVKLDKQETVLLKKYLLKVLGDKYGDYVTDTVKPLQSLKDNRRIKQAIALLEEEKWKNLKTGIRFARAFLSWEKGQHRARIIQNLKDSDREYATPDKDLRKAMLNILEVEFGSSDTASYKADPRDYLTIGKGDKILTDQDIAEGLMSKGVNGVLVKSKKVAKKELETRKDKIDEVATKEIRQNFEHAINKLKGDLKNKNLRSMHKTRARLALMLADTMQDLSMDVDAQWKELFKPGVRLDKNDKLHKKFIKEVSKRWTLGESSLKTAFNSFTNAMNK